MRRTAACLGFVLIATPLVAGGLDFSRPFGGTGFEARTRVLDRRAAMLDTTAVWSDSSGAITPSLQGHPRYDGAYRGPYLALARRAARRHRVPEDLFLRLVQQESAWNAAALSPKGAIGLAQLMPATARALGVNPRDPVENLDGGARYLRRQYERFRTWRLALAAYNAGPEAVDRYGGVPPYQETLNYVRKILGG